MLGAAIARGVLAPALVAALVLVLAWRPWLSGARAPDGRWSGAPAIGLAFLVGFAATIGPPRLPFAGGALSGQEWLAWIALAAGVPLAVAARPGRAAVLRGLLTVALVEGVLRAMFVHHWSGAPAILWFAGLALALNLHFWSAEALARRAPGAAMPLSWIVVGTGLALTSGLTGSTALAQLAGAATAALGPALVLAWWRPRFSLAGGAATMVVLVLFGIGLCARFYSSLPRLEASLLLCAPFLAWVAELPPLRSRRPRVRALARALAVLVPVAAAVTSAALAYESDPYAGY